METLQGWYRDASEEEPQLLHQTDPPVTVTAADLLRLSGVRYFRVEDYESEKVLKELAHGCQSTDYIHICREAMGDDFEQKVTIYCSEHLHEDSEVRLVVAGSAFFDIRTYDDVWLRVFLVAGDCIDIPPGTYHRLSLDPSKHVKMYRLFTETPHWTAVMRPEGDNHPSRIKHLAGHITQPQAVH